MSLRTYTISAHFDLAEFERLLSRFAELRRAAHGLETPNPQDDELIKLAIVGFSLHQQMELWSRGHYEFVVRRREGDLSDESLEWFGEFIPSVATFSCLALGAMQGLYDK